MLYIINTKTALMTSQPYLLSYIFNFDPQTTNTKIIIIKDCSTYISLKIALSFYIRNKLTRKRNFDMNQNDRESHEIDILYFTFNIILK
jgi:hypothetical protein